MNTFLGEGGIDLKILVIAEKPKLAGNCAAGLALLGEELKRGNGCYEGENYIVTWCVGHLLGLSEIADYTGERSWSSVSLPYIPEKFEFKVKEDTKEQYSVVEQLINRPDIKQIYHLGDADREGEVIVRNVLQRAGNKNPVMRIWTDDQTETALADAIRKVRPDKEYDNLYNEGLARTYMDWLYGINLTRYLTLRTNSRPPLRVGRVLIPVVKKIYDREMEIRNFVSVPYLQAEGTGEKDGIEYALILKNEEPRLQDSDVKKIVEQLKHEEVIVKDIKKKEKTISRPKLFDLGKAQARIAKLHKVGMTESMGCIQALYENGYLSYPRTDSEYLADTEMDKVDEIIRSIQKKYPEVHIQQRTDKSVYDNSRVIGHSALRPTYKIPDETVFASLVSTAKQKAGSKAIITADTVRFCYQTILNRFLAVFATEDCRIAESEIIVSAGEYEFILKGQQTISKGFTSYDNTVKRDNELPVFEKGEHLQVKWILAKKKTMPPKRMTVESLNNYLINPFKTEVDDDYKAITEGLSIGTQATRTGIIQNAIDSQYIDCKNNSYYLLDRGEYLITTMNTLQIDLYKDKTVEFNRLLIAVNKGTLSIEDVINMSTKDITSELRQADTIQNIKVCEDTGEHTSFTCPFCQGKVIKGKYGYYCKDNKDFSYSQIRGVDVTEEMMKAFMENKKILIKGMISEKGNYDAYVIPEGWEHHDKYTNLVHTLEFPQKKRRSKK